MLATVWRVLVAEGEAVGTGQDVILLEAMKMEIPVASPAAGVVEAIYVAEGDSVDDGSLLFRLV